MLRQGVSECFDPSFPLEWYQDLGGVYDCCTAELVGLHRDAVILPGRAQYDKILVRPEFRCDHSTANFVSVSNTAGLNRQATLGLAWPTTSN